MPLRCAVSPPHACVVAGRVACCVCRGQCCTASPAEERACCASPRGSPLNYARARPVGGRTAIPGTCPRLRRAGVTGWSAGTYRYGTCSGWGCLSGVTEVLVIMFYFGLVYSRIRGSLLVTSRRKQNGVKLTDIVFSLLGKSSAKF